MGSIWDDHFGASIGSGAAVVVGEFGGHNVGADKIWHSAFVDYIKLKGFGSFYWCANPSSSDTGGLLLSDWKTVDEGKARALHGLSSSSVSKNLRHFKRKQ